MKDCRKLICIFIFALSLFVSPLSSFASELYNIEIEVYVQSDGSADIVEKRNMTFDTGTEIYLVQENMGNSEITDFTVKEGDSEYEKVSQWNVDDSIDQKAKKSGIIDTGSGYELCFSPGKYGDYDFELTYHVTNFVKGVEDGQMIYWKFINEGQDIMPHKAQVNIYPPEGYVFSKDNTKIWSFGYQGEQQITDSHLYAKSSEPMDQSNYMVVLAQFSEGLVSNPDYVGGTLSSWEDKAKEGSDYFDEVDYDHTTGYKQNDKFFFFSSLLRVIFPVLLFFLFFKLGTTSSQSSKEKPKKINDDGNPQYYREAPYTEGNPTDMVYMLGKMNLKMDDYLTMFFLKWIYEEKLKSVETERGWIFKSKSTALKIIDENIDFDQDTDPLEKELFQMVEDASGSDRILSENEFTTYARNHYKTVLNWANDVVISSYATMREKEYLTQKDEKGLLFTKPVTYPTKKGQELVNNSFAFKRFLEDYSLLNEQKDIHVHIWDELMIWAGLFGITEKVQEQFEKLYPKYFEEGDSHFNYNTLYLASLYSTSFSSGAYSSSTSAGSSGFGGGSSLGGGGGSFGGGSGGGTR